MGLHRESSLNGLPPFEAEMRRRVWWQAVILDTRAAQLTGVSLRQDVELLGDTKQPVNVNDSDLTPSMGMLPPASATVTDMVFCSVRYEIGIWMVRNRSLLGMAPPSELKAKLIKSIDDLEQALQDRYLREIDTNVPLNLLTTYLAQSAISQLRLSVYDPIHRRERGSDLDQDQLDVLFDNSLKVIQLDILANSTPSLERYNWHVANFFPFEAFVLLISTLPGRATRQMVDVAWDVINQVYEHHPCFVTDASDPLYSALADLTLRSWVRWSAAARTAGAIDQQQPAEPPCIAKLVAERRVSQPTPFPAPNNIPQVDTSLAAPLPPPFSSPLPLVQADTALPVLDNMHATMDWGFWQELLDSSAGIEGEQQDPFSFASWMVNSGYSG